LPPAHLIEGRAAASCWARSVLGGKGDGKKQNSEWASFVFWAVFSVIGARIIGEHT